MQQVFVDNKRAKEVSWLASRGVAPVWVKRGYLCLLLVLVLLGSVVAEASGQEAEERALDVSFLFQLDHSLAPLNEARTAGQVALLETLRSHPDLSFQLHLSGTLLHTHTWFDTRVIDLVREGVRSGQFELLGSTYAQNVLVASDDTWTNAQQMKTHRQLLNKLFDVEPVGFWNPGRVWHQKLVPQIAAEGYRYTMVESHILEEMPLRNPVHIVRKTTRRNQKLAVFHDDTAFRDLVDDAVNSGSFDALLAYLRERYEADTRDEFVVAYYQDLEGRAPWVFEQEAQIHQTMQNLDALLATLQQQEWLNITTGAQVIEERPPRRELTPISSGEAEWMRALSQQLGYEDWYDYKSRDSVQVLFRPLYDQVRDSLRAVSRVVEDASNEAGMQLFQRAVRTFVAHEYRYGTRWPETTEDIRPEAVGETLVSLLAVRQALHPIARNFMADVNLDGVEEVVLATPEDLYVFSIRGGRLLYWFDLQHGVSLVGNELSSDNGDSDVADEEEALQVGQWALRDRFYMEGETLDSLVYQIYDVAIEDSAVSFSYTHDAWHLQKHIRPVDDGTLEVTYILENRGADDQALAWLVESSFSPSYLSIMDHGATSLSYRNGTTSGPFDSSVTRGVQNVQTGVTVSYTFTDQPTTVQAASVVWGLKLNPTYEVHLEPGASQSLRFSLVRTIR